MNKKIIKIRDEVPYSATINDLKLKFIRFCSPNVKALSGYGNTNDSKLVVINYKDMARPQLNLADGHRQLDFSSGKIMRSDIFPTYEQQKESLRNLFVNVDGEVLIFRQNISTDDILRAGVTMDLFLVLQQYLWVNNKSHKLAEIDYEDNGTTGKIIFRYEVNPELVSNPYLLNYKFIVTPGENKITCEKDYPEGNLYNYLNDVT
ncbi:MAG: hypothetical protein DKM50_00620 [Candidatus Margulisiibacteriota bacterium]|nr:MAG: hypothetical protein A2X43_05480 [Candidatus Margulisbacteria bacterium GWD2_39_127]OGI04364.1 MAG: hypothetical protein A2X42_07160 [Candidatus Margulisbacteria bacterium GWF2_38_17]OGI07780.1 MAG: hypothetical protein A2X41_07810 [Candidatus Margulisbacteria bacterium GWE2_39_32]PZM84829.1 MAG: hypothetical protein DKM50_00620 [Candidatus Margulisiibacteriota bacterium]HAR63298.1 hypothetical protein [Candidatus Margulisiibacteriota bacterium]